MKEFIEVFYYGKTPLEGIEKPLKTMVKMISEFYNKPVIILVDEHDYPIRKFAGNIMETTNDKNLEELVRQSSDTINNMLEAIGKGNQYVKKFLMLGVLNMVVNYSNSDFDNLKIHNIFEPKYSEYFGMTQTEVDRVIDKLFPVKKEIKDKIRANINKWYNGYYHKQGSILYSIFSVNLYINECFEAYTKQYTESKDFQDYWVPEPKPFWSSLGKLFLLSQYLNFGFGGKNGHFLRDLSLDCPVYYQDFDPQYVSRFKNITDLEEKVKIQFHSMVHGGYLTQLNKDKKLFGIPNFELKRLLIDKLDTYLKEFIHYDFVGRIFFAMTIDDFEELGKMIAWYLRDVFISQKNKKFKFGVPPPEVFIYRMLLNMLETQYENIYDTVAHEHDGRTLNLQNAPKGVQTENYQRQYGFKVNLYLIEKYTDKKTHYVIEFKADKKDAKEMKNNALEGLSQIFREDSHQHISPLPETKAIVNIGLSFEANSVCLVALKVHVVDGKYVKVDPLKHIEFKIDLAYHDFIIKVDRTKQEEFDFQLPEFSKNSNSSPTENDSPEVHNRKARDYIFNQIEELKKSDTATTTQNQAKKGDQRKQ
jgi:hypothetical protein